MNTQFFCRFLTSKMYYVFNTFMIISQENSQQSTITEKGKINKFSTTALMEVSRKGQTDTVKALLEKGADIHEKDGHKSTALIYASENGHIDTVNTLINNGANVNDRNNQGWTPLMFASRDGYIEIVDTLLENGAGASINEKNKQGCWTALMYACRKGHIDIVKALLENGAEISINEKSVYGRTALMYACGKAHTDIVKALLEKGASISEKNNDNETALDIARRKNSDHIVQLLESSPMSKSARM